MKLNLPVEGKSWVPNIYAGPYLAFMLGADIDGNDVKDAFKSTDFGLVVGVGLDFKLSEGNRMLELDFRYSMGITKIYDFDDLDIKAFNNGFQFLLGYGFSM
jgi:opacity protein-like surface antigen